MREKVMAVLMALLCLSVSAAWSQEPKTQAAPPQLTAEQRQIISERVLAHERVRAWAGGQRVRAVRLTLAEPEKDAPPEGGVEVILVNYVTNASARVRVDIRAGTVTELVPLNGHPQSSEGERAEARALLERDKVVQPLLASGADVVGGFVVPAPEGTREEGRYLEFHIVSGDRKTILLETFVNLLTGEVHSKEVR